MPGFDLRNVRDNFPNLPAKALEFFHPDNAVRHPKKIVPRTIHEFAIFLQIPDPENSNRSYMPKWQLLNKICKILAEYDILTSYGGGGPHGWDEAYMTNINDDNHIIVSPFLDYIVYGFPVIFEDYKKSVLPIVRTDERSDRAIGTAFVHNGRVLITAAHCIADAKSISIKGVSELDWQRAKVYISKNDAIDLCAIILAEDMPEEIKRLPIRRGDVLDEVIVMGYPNVPGFTDLIAVENATISSRIAVTKGAIASSATEVWAGTELFLITARVRGGFSGGPVIRERGEVVGVVSRQPLRGVSENDQMFQNYDGLGYGVAIPSEEISRLLTAVRKCDDTLRTELNHNAIKYVEWEEDN